VGEYVVCVSRLSASKLCVSRLLASKLMRV